MMDTRPLEPAAYLTEIVDSSDDAMITKDLQGVIHASNAAATRIFGYTAGELKGQSIRTLIPPDRQTEEDEILRRIAAGERIDHLETVRLRKDGRAIDVSVSISPVRDADGRVVGAFKIARDITELKRARAGQAYLAAIVDSSEDAILSKDLDGIIQSCNKTAERIFGYAAHELVGRSVRMLIPPDRQHEEDEILGRIRQGQRIAHFETVRLKKNGDAIDISLSVSPIFDPAGKIIGVSKIARDITEQKRLARELAAQQEWFRVTLASIGDAVIASDVEGNVAFQNARAESLTGWTTEESAGRPLTDIFRIVDERSGAAVANPAERVLRSGRVVALGNHVALIARDGSLRPIADSAAPIRDARGRTIGVVLIFRDVSEERRAEEALNEQREWYETTLESIGDAVIATDAKGRVVFMNRIAETLTGWSARAARGRDCSDVFRIINEGTRGRVDSPVAKVLAEGVIESLDSHTLLIAADGTEVPIDDSGAPIRRRDGQIVGTVLVFRDISERRRSENERRLAVAERERILASERAARTEAERATRVKDEFVAMVSHELRTPLNAILGWSHLMAQSEHNPDVIRRGVDVIARNTRVQAQLISDLLDVSGIMSGKLRLAVEQVDPAVIVSEAVETVQPSAHEKGVAIRTDLEQNVGSIAADPSRLQQVIWNLLWNAIKFTPAGGSVAVSLRRSGPNVEITVSDTGLGIPADFLPHLFERFQQASPSITRRFGGLGLGLSIVKYLVDMHGGRVSAESEGEGKGSRFTVSIPAAGPTVRSTAGAAGSRSSPDDATTLADLAVVIVEDDRDTLDFLARYLTSCGARVTTATSAAEALAILPGVTADVLVSDIGLPEMDGYELIRKVRGSEPGRGAGIPAIALTAYARPDDRSRAFRAGFQAHLAKPIEPTDLVAAIVRLVPPSRARAPRP
ncbi:MAG: PAS domain S-box protein [Gemmatimonadales bacterium]